MQNSFAEQKRKPQNKQKLLRLKPSLATIRPRAEIHRQTPTPRHRWLPREPSIQSNHVNGMEMETGAQVNA
jgi:hypothetical protein